eukprot:TRINITY_DN78846_c0_g1_i1.p1 TRINITY_DN78846_c0_g1~~TRINITY_DN78846_c0_g1_i1.p1  ORF type:complete len:355 (-),score=13.54 TRINITY_DN78846_c0_g1_i1:20-1084(-)
MTLCTDTLCDIFAYLEFDTLLDCCCVNTDWRRAGRAEFLWQDLNVHHWGRLSQQALSLYTEPTTETESSQLVTLTSYCSEPEETDARASLAQLNLFKFNYHLTVRLGLCGEEWNFIGLEQGGPDNMIFAFHLRLLQEPFHYRADGTKVRILNIAYAPIRHDNDPVYAPYYVGRQGDIGIEVSVARCQPQQEGKLWWECKLSVAGTEVDDDTLLGVTPWYALTLKDGGLTLWCEDFNHLGAGREGPAMVGVCSKLPGAPFLALDLWKDARKPADGVLTEVELAAYFQCLKGLEKLAMNYERKVDPWDIQTQEVVEVLGEKPAIPPANFGDYAFPGDSSKAKPCRRKRRRKSCILM